MHWMQLVAMWTQLQEYLIHLIDRVPDEKWATLCRIGGDEAIPFSKLMENYTRHCEEVLGKILTRG
jgi:hypothetical protein